MNLFDRRADVPRRVVERASQQHRPVRDGLEEPVLHRRAQRRAVQHRRGDSVAPKTPGTLRNRRLGALRFHRRDEPGDPALPSLTRFGFFDGGDVLALEAKGQTFESRPGRWVVVEGPGEDPGGSGTTLGSVSSSRSTPTTSPSPIPLAARFAALIPTRHCPRINATRLRHVWPLIVMAMSGRAPEPRAFLDRLRDLDTGGVAGGNDLGFELHVCVLPARPSNPRDSSGVTIRRSGPNASRFRKELGLRRAPWHPFLMVRALLVSLLVVASVGCAASLVPPSQQGTATENCLAICRSRYTGQSYLDCADYCGK